MYKMKLMIILAVLSTSLLAKTSGSCWDIREIGLMGDAELDGNIIFSFKDSKTCKPIVKAKVSFLDNIYISDDKGYVIIPAPPSSIDADIPLMVKKDKYITLEQNVKAQVGSFWQNRFLLAKGMPLKSAKFILLWGDKPSDLDLHLVSDDFHISYRNKNNSSTKVKLDRDSMNGYGPETITLDLLDKNKTYSIFIYKYTSSGSFNHNVNLTLYKNNKLDKVISLDDGIKGSCVKVATIKNNKVIYDIQEVEHKKGTCK